MNRKEWMETARRYAEKMGGSPEGRRLLQRWSSQPLMSDADYYEAAYEHMMDKLMFEHGQLTADAA